MTSEAPTSTVLVDDLDRLRRRTATKWTRHASDVLPAWVAEADVEPHPGVAAALLGLLERGDLGYPADDLPDRLAATFAARMADRWGWAADAAGVQLTCDVVQGLATTLVATTDPGDGVLVLLPSYPPILSLVEQLDRRLVPHQLERAEGWALDSERLLADCDEGVRAVVLVHPHNPTGRSFTVEELESLAALAVDRGLVVLSDEIHQDLTWTAGHVPFASVSAAAAARTVTLTSAAKSHALAGLRCAVAHVGEELRGRVGPRPAVLAGGPAVTGVVATLAAWESDGTWEAALADELLARRAQVAAFLDEHLPQAGHRVPEATFLSWLDLRELGLGDDPAAFFEERARVALGHGPDFGPAGRGHVRLNWATGAGVLSEVLERMVTALDLRSG